MPFELTHQVKPDLRVLFKLFCIATVHHEHQGDLRLGKFDSQSIAMIAIGHCPNSNGIQFNNPQNGSFVSSIDYKFQPDLASGAHFGFEFQPGTFVYQLDESTSVFSPSFPLDSSALVHTHSPPPLATIVGIPTYDSPQVYTVAFKDGSICEYTEDLLSLAPPISSSTMSSGSSLLPTWIKGGANVTFFLNDMSKPCHGTYRCLLIIIGIFILEKILLPMVLYYLIFWLIVRCFEYWTVV
jgi:hypothetical protein